VDEEITEINIGAFKDEVRFYYRFGCRRDELISYVSQVILFKELVTKITDFIDDLELIFMWKDPGIRCFFSALQE
jgi:hypothetical protein